MANNDGIVYLIKFDIPDIDENIFKIGVTQKMNLYDRYMEILADYWQTFGYVPYNKPIRYERVPRYQMMEKYLHGTYFCHKYSFDKEFSGHTEYFIIPDTDELLELYDKLVIEYRESNETESALF